MDKLSKALSDYTPQARDIIKKSVGKATERKSGFVGTEHILLSIFDFKRSTAAYILSRHGVTAEDINAVLGESGELSEGFTLGEKSFTQNARRVISGSSAVAKSLGVSKVGSEHILMMLIRAENSAAASALRELGISLPELYSDCASISCGFEAGEPKQKRFKALEKYGAELTSAKVQRTLDSCFERDEQIEQIARILLRRRKNNPCLIGEAGVGKSAIVEGLAKLIYEGNAPEALLGKRIFKLDLSLILAGAKYRGDFEQRLRECLAEASGDKDVILFIDELHSIMGTGAAEGAIDAASILKPQLARGTLRLIGATTYDEYRACIEKDAALDRRFAKVTVEEPDEDKTRRILMGLKSSYESFHDVRISDEAIDEAIRLSKRYLTEKFFPDKAIDLIDEACSLMRLSIGGEDSSKAFNSYVSGEISRDEYLLAISKRTAQKTLKGSDIKRLISKNLNIPLSDMTDDEERRLDESLRKLNAEVIGQPEAAAALVGALKRSRLGIGESDGTMGAFIFAGESGVGKTAMCVSAARELFGEGALIRFDMSEFSEPHTVSRLIGAPAGYVGYEDSGELCEKVRRKPYSLVLFDEIEKAHRDVFNLLLQILDTGFLEDSKGARASFKNTIIVLTTNLGVKGKAAVGFSDKSSSQKAKDEIKSAVLKFLPKELVNRFDGIICFEPLSDKTLEKIATARLSSLKAACAEKGVTLSFSSRLLPFVLAKAKELDSGGRGIIKLVDNSVRQAVADEMISSKGGRLKVTVTDGKITCVNLSCVSTAEVKTAS